jgi:hypothetical protein
MKKALLINIPLTENLYPSASLAAISPVFKKNNYLVEIKDLNVKLFSDLPEDITTNINDWCQLTAELSSGSAAVLDGWLDQEFSTWTVDPMDILAVSVFSFYSILFGRVFLQKLRAYFPNNKIIVGGSGVSSDIGNVIDNMTFGEYIQKYQLADHVIFGEGEISLDQLLNSQSGPGIDFNNPEQINDLDALLPPDYSDFNFDLYQDRRLLITASRGCVRKCTFCDIEVTWPKFKHRSPESCVKEIIEHSKRYNIKKFDFTDSLINGSVSGWIKFNDLLANARARDPDLNDITYSGQFICREASSQPKIMYELMHYAGARQITVGIESFSESIRADMKKKFSNSAIDYHLEQCAEWAIPNILLMIVGYPGETLGNHNENITALHRYKQYSDMGVIFMIRWGLTMHIYKDTPLFKNINQYQIDLAQHQHNSDGFDAIYTWVSSLNPGLDFVERARRRVELHSISHELGYSQPNTRSELSILLNLLKNYTPAPTKKNFIIQSKF